MELIPAYYALSNAAAGLITSLPLLAFVAVSPFVAHLSSRIGHAKPMMAGLFLILIAFLAFCGITAGSSQTVSE